MECESPGASGSPGGPYFAGGSPTKSAPSSALVSSVPPPLPLPPRLEVPRRPSVSPPTFESTGSGSTTGRYRERLAIDTAGSPRGSSCWVYQQEGDTPTSAWHATLADGREGGLMSGTGSCLSSLSVLETVSTTRSAFSSTMARFPTCGLATCALALEIWSSCCRGCLSPLSCVWRGWVLAMEGCLIDATEEAV